MDHYLKEQFLCPGADKRSIPFWAWNGRMEKEEVKSQIRQMKQAGVGGFFIHSRIGLETDYMGEEWMSCVEAAVAEAKEQGLYVWLYDEDRWPSGTAGGRVTSRGDAYRCKGLTLEILDTGKYGRLYREEISPLSGCGVSPESGCGVSPESGCGVSSESGCGVSSESGCDALPESGCDASPLSEYHDGRVGLLAVYCAVVEADAVKSYRRLALREKEVFSSEEVLLAVRLEVSAPSAWFNNETPPDNLNPDCVKKFLQETHEKYKQAIGEEFGKTVLGIFTDEPSLNDRFTRFGERKSWIPWTYGFGSYFEERAGYDFFDVLPLFYFHGERSEKIRHDYWCSITQRYRDSYFKVISEWCVENHLLFTGHMLHEGNLGLCTRVNGAVMPNYQYMHVPGIDMLCEQTDEYLTVKQCVSVARQSGKKQVITETYGCTGWDFTFEGQKWIGDWQYVLGVNRRCQHLMLYSLRGCRKRDYPPSFNYNTSWWDYNNIVDDYFARLSVVLETGDAVRDILLLHPASTAWSRMGVNPYGNPRRKDERDVPGLNKYGAELNKLIEYLERHHLDLDLGDELMIRQCGAAVSEEFAVGEARYRAVVLPPMDTILRSTCDKLTDYMEQGGFVYAMTPYPFMVEGSSEHEDSRKRLISHEHWIAVGSKEELITRLEPYRSIRIEDASGEECGDVLCQLRKEENEYYLFLVNNSRSREADVTVKLPFSAIPVRMELLTGEIGEEPDYENGTEGMCLQVHLHKTGSALYCLRAQHLESYPDGQRSESYPDGLYSESDADGLRSESYADGLRSESDPDGLRSESYADGLRSESDPQPVPENGSGAGGNADSKDAEHIRYAGPFPYELDRKNVLPLDRCRYRMEGREWSEEQEVWKAQKTIRENLNMQPIHSNDIEQRYRWAGKAHPQNGCGVEMAFRFSSKQCIDHASIALERPEDFRILLNGNEVLWKTEGWLLDKEIKKCRLPQIRQGDNELILICAYRNDMELENIYLEGDFGVDENRCLTELPQTLCPGSWTEQGLKHYCGSVIYRLEYLSEDADCQGRLWLKLPYTEAVCVKVLVNKHELLLPWNFEQAISIEDWICQGKNQIEIAVVGSPRNMMGPFHVRDKPYNTNPESFCVTGEAYSEEYLAVPYGIMDDILLYKA